MRSWWRIYEQSLSLLSPSAAGRERKWLVSSTDKEWMISWTLMERVVHSSFNNINVEGDYSEYFVARCICWAAQIYAEKWTTGHWRLINFEVLTNGKQKILEFNWVKTRLKNGMQCVCSMGRLCVTTCVIAVDRFISINIRIIFNMSGIEDYNEDWTTYLVYDRTESTLILWK